MRYLYFIAIWSAVAGGPFAQELPLRRIDAPLRLATLRAVENQTLHFAEEELASVPMAELLRWGAPVECRGGSFLLLSDGSIVAGEVTGVTARDVQISSVRAPNVWRGGSIPRSALRAVVHQSSSSSSERERFAAELLGSSDTEDRLLLVGGDSLTGTISNATLVEAGMELAYRIIPSGAKEALTIAQSRVVAAVCAATSREPARGRFWLGLSDGSLVQVNEIKPRDEFVELALSAGGSLTALAIDNNVEPPEPLVSRFRLIQPLPERVVYLSDLKTIGFKHIPLLDWPLMFANDRNVQRATLRAGGVRYLKGIGMPATSRLAYEIPPGAEQFEAEVAIDDLAGPTASAQFRVFLEASPGTWKTAWESKIARAGDPPQAVRLPLAESRRLALVVEMADRGDQCDWANWLDARFVRPR